MKLPIRKSNDRDRADLMIKKWLNRIYPLNHSTSAYVGMYCIWDVMGKNEIESDIFIHGHTDKLIQLRDRICEAIDEEIERRQKKQNG